MMTDRWRADWTTLGKRKRTRCFLCGHHALPMFVRKAKLPGHSTREWVCTDEEKCAARKAEIEGAG